MSDTPIEVPAAVPVEATVTEVKATVKATVSWRNFHESPITTILGLVLTCAAIYTPLHKEGATWSDAAIGIAVGVVLMLAPDTIVARVQALIKPTA
jgi:hypothetical protein